MGFKSYHKAFLSIAPLTLLIGANAAGKTNCIEAIRFLSRLANGQRIDDILNNIRQHELSIRGEIVDIPYGGPLRLEIERAPVIGFGVKLHASTKWKDWFTCLSMRPAPEESRVIADQITEFGNPAGPFLYETNFSGIGRYEAEVTYEDFENAIPRLTTPCSNRQAVLTQLDLPSRFATPEAQETIPAVVTEFQEALRQIIFLDLNPRAMVNYSFIVEHILQPNGRNLSSVLYDLCVTQQREAEVLAFIGDLPEQRISAIKFIETPRREVMVQLTETFGDTETDREAPLLSDGTLRVLAIAAALLSAPTGGLVVVEEIDNGVHPSRARELLANILAASKKNSLRVLLTSHNPALLDTLPKEAVPDVVCCYRDPEQGDSRLVRLADLTDYPDLVARGPLGQLMTQGLLDRYLKNQRTPAEKAAQAQEWLRQLQLTEDEDDETARPE